MIPCIVVFVISVLGLLISRLGKYKKEQLYHMLLLSAAVSLFAMLAGYLEHKDMALKEGGYLLRQEAGTGTYETELLLQAAGMDEQSFVINVPERILTEAEEAAYLQAALEEIEEEFKGENASLEEIREQVIIRDLYQNGFVSAEWEFSNYRLFEEDGVIIENALTEEGEVVLAAVALKCGSSRLIQSFSLQVYSKKKSEEEAFLEKIYALIAENGKAEGTEWLMLPQEVEGRTLVWKEKSSHRSIQILFLGLFVVLLIPKLEKEREKEQKEKREEALLREYPEMVNKLSLLLAAGMTVQGAWNKITDMYLQAREKKQIPISILHEEMLITRHEMESGRGEIRSYEAFGERCALPQYRKFSNYLVQNLKKGSGNISQILEKEAGDVWAEKKNQIRRYGEEAATKMLVPMLFMLGIVIFIIMVPAVISFQAGV